MNQRRKFLLGSLFIAQTTWAADQPRIVNIQFGIIREVSPDQFEFVSETTQIPRKYKDSGFRWGIGFENPTRKPIEWYEVIHLPAPLKEVSGNFQRTRNTVMRTKTFSGSRPSVVDDFWFDEGDPLGQHKIELYVNGKVRCSIDFQVVEAR